LIAAWFPIAAAAADANDRIVYNQNIGLLFYDADGGGGSARVQLRGPSARTSPSTTPTSSRSPDQDGASQPGTSGPERTANPISRRSVPEDRRAPE
jgi:hypothetical protein